MSKHPSRRATSLTGPICLSQMSDSDVESFARAVGPMTNTVHKHISRGQGWAQDTFQRSAAKVSRI